MQRETSQQGSRPSTNARLSYATDRAKVLFGSYRRGDANDPDIYVTSVAAVLTLYDFDLIREVTDPRTGIQTTEEHMTFMPQSGELKRYCDKVAAHRDRMKRLADMPRPVPASHRLAAPTATEPGSLANVFVDQYHHRYARLVEKAQAGDVRMWKFGQSSDGRSGIWIARNLWEDDGARPSEQWKSYTAEDLVRMYRKQPEQPEQQQDEVPFE